MNTRRENLSFIALWYKKEKKTDQKGRRETTTTKTPLSPTHPRRSTPLVFTAASRKERGGEKAKRLHRLALPPLGSEIPSPAPALPVVVDGRKTPRPAPPRARGPVARVGGPGGEEAEGWTLRSAATSSVSFFCCCF